MTALAEMRFYAPAEDSREMRYLRERRAALGGICRRAGEVPDRWHSAAESYARSR